jgi:hypothetical protein
MAQLLFRFVVGGLVVSFFAALADVLKPKSFAGLFGAAPSVGLATLDLTIASEGKSYAAIEARSMAVASIAFLVYAWIACRLMLRNRRWTAVSATTVVPPVWFAISFGLWALVLR